MPELQSWQPRHHHWCAAGKHWWQHPGMMVDCEHGDQYPCAEHEQQVDAEADANR